MFRTDDCSNTSPKPVVFSLCCSFSAHWAEIILNLFIKIQTQCERLNRTITKTAIACEDKVAFWPTGLQSSYNGEDWPKYSGLKLTNRGQTSGSLWGTGSYAVPCRRKQEKRGATWQRELEGKIWFPAVMRRICHWFRKCLEVPLSVWQEWRR